MTPPPDPRPDPFLREAVRARHDSPMQRKLRRIRPVPVGAVFLPWPGMTEAEARNQLRAMREVGFTMVKQFMATPEWPIPALRRLAFEEGLCPWVYGDGGWEDPTPERLAELGLPADLSPAELRAHPGWRARQREVLARRLEHQDRHDEDRTAVDHKLKVEAVETPPERLEDTTARPGFGLPPMHEDLYFRWLEDRYGSIGALNAAWNTGHVGILREPFASFADARARYGELSRNEYRHRMDEQRFKAECAAARTRNLMRSRLAEDPDAPCRAGGEISLYYPHAWWGVDLELIADVMAEGGSFYPSIHLAWHFGETDAEFVRPVYQHAALTNDLFKGGWAATWESTGGPQQFSGGRGHHAERPEELDAFTVHAGTIAQLMLSYLAGGLRGIGLWTWNARTAGWEAGEYALVDRNLRPTARARRAGSIARAADRWRDELWDAVKEPMVGVLVDWWSDALWAAVGEVNRERFQRWGIRGRIGVSRALQNANVPFEYVTPADLRAGLGPRYGALVLPQHLGLDPDLMPILEAYVAQGGRLAMDAPGGWMDAYGRTLPTGEGSDFARLFGFTLDDFQFGTNVPYAVDGAPHEGFVAETTPIGARVRRRRDDGAPLVLEHAFGGGAAVYVAADLSRRAWRSGDAQAEALLREAILDGRRPPFACDGVLAYRLPSPDADHYFLINDGPATTAVLDPLDLAYSGRMDAETGEVLDPAAPIAVEAHGARWIRCPK